MKKTIICIAMSTLLASCTEKKVETTKETDIRTQEIENIAQVDTIELKESVFYSNIISNGKIRAGEYADLFFRNAELVEEVRAHNGQHVTKGEMLAKLDLYKLNNTLKQQEADMEQARLEMQDIIIGQGYDPEKMKEVPDDVKSLARMRSGLDKVEAAYQSTLRDIEDASLTAPFSGVVANVKVQKYSMAPTAEPAMRIINDGSMCIEFPVLDSEIALIKSGDEVEVMPYSGNDSYKGRITEINPIVEENGQIIVKASLDRSIGLIDGLNAKVKINRSFGKALIVPKSAVVLRSGREVVFTWENNKAMWNYVKTGLENFDSYVVSEGLRPGQRVIINGNENLAHEAPVELTR